MSIIGRRARAAAALIILMSLAVASSAEAQGVDLKSTRHRSHYKREGISRVREWSVESEEIPESFDGFKMVFVTDTHYPSKFTDRTLEGLRRLLIEISPDALLLGGGLSGRLRMGRAADGGAHGLQATIWGIRRHG